MQEHLLISVHMLDGRYHGMNEWRPSPGRLFQALVAGPATGQLSSQHKSALEWLEQLPPPIVGTPAMVLGQKIANFVPDNDIDAVGGDMMRVAEIRSAKVIQPQLFNAEVPFLFAWRLSEPHEPSSDAICELAAMLYQFGRGVDMAWAVGEVVNDVELDGRLRAYRGRIAAPTVNSNERSLRCPVEGTLASLDARHRAQGARFALDVGRQLFAQPPKPVFAMIGYDAGPSRVLYELRADSPASSFKPWPIERVTRLITWVRDSVVERLMTAFPDREHEIRRTLVGRQQDGTDASPPNSRVRIVPLPSIGHEYADRGVRRLLVEIPSDCPLRAVDVHWAFSGLPISDPETGEIFSLLTPASDDTMLRHYGLRVGDESSRSRAWRTVTPAALPEAARRRRIEPARRAAEAKNGSERQNEESRAVACVHQALRHAGLSSEVATVRVRREPFSGKGRRAEAFAEGTRFVKERLWHVEIELSTPIEGPLVIGDGRFLGLGVMEPVRDAPTISAFHVVKGLSATADPSEIAVATRRAIMSRAQQAMGRGRLPTFFSGHETDGSPARDHRHLAFVFDPRDKRILVLAPHHLHHPERTRRRDSSVHLELLEHAMSDFTELRAGASGRLELAPTIVDLDSDPLFAPSREWVSLTPYRATRTPKRISPNEALSLDIRAECLRVGLPAPEVQFLEVRGGTSHRALQGRAVLTFPKVVYGPILLGKSMHLGGGLFIAQPRK